MFAMQRILRPRFMNNLFNATYGNIVGRNMLRAFGHHVVTC